MPPKVPSGFTPGNGDAQNDLLWVFGGPFRELEFKIYNNWGELIFESTDVGDCSPHTCIGWDGTKAGVAQPMGVYIWTLKAVSVDDQPHEASGDVTLIR